MPESKLSTIERLHQAYDERHILGSRGIRLAITPRSTPTAEAQAQAARMASARDLPDSLCDNDSEVKRMRSVHQALAAASQDRRALHRWLGEECQRREAALKLSEQTMCFNAFTDAAVRDETFVSLQHAVEAHQREKTLIAALRVARERLQSEARLSDAVDLAKANLEARLLALKLAHVDAQEQLKESV